MFITSSGIVACIQEQGMCFRKLCPNAERGIVCFQRL